MAAIVAAITAYVSEEPLMAAVTVKKANLWVTWGRREMMRMRTLWQLRVTDKSRLMRRAAFPPREGGARYDYRVWRESKEPG